MIRRIVHIIDRINDWVGKFVGLWLLFLMAVILYEITARYVFSRPTLWAHEMSTFIFGISWVLAGGFVIYKKSMVNMDVLYMRLTAKVKAILDLCTIVFSLSFIALLILQSGEKAWKSIVIQETSGSVWNPIYFPVRIALFLGAVLVLLQLISKFIKDLRTATGRKDDEY